MNPLTESRAENVPALADTGADQTVIPERFVAALTSGIPPRPLNMSAIEATNRGTADLPWAMLNGATVVKKETWDAVPADLRPKLLEISRSYGRRLALEVRKLNDDALKQLKAKGVQTVPAGDLAAWKKAADSANTVVRGKVVPAPVFDEVMKHHNEFRLRGKKQ